MDAIRRAYYAARIRALAARNLEALDDGRLRAAWVAAEVEDYDSWRDMMGMQAPAAAPAASATELRAAFDRLPEPEKIAWARADAEAWSAMGCEVREPQQGAG